ncbi:MAG: hypothetical protein ACRDO8_11115, partial [Nocardioidaceae bacterium]
MTNHAIGNCRGRRVGAGGLDHRAGPTVGPRAGKPAAPVRYSERSGRLDQVGEQVGDGGLLLVGERDTGPGAHRTTEQVGALVEEHDRFAVLPGGD